MEEVTGYIYEPWHLRYVGPACAAEWQESGLTLIEVLRGDHLEVGLQPS
jgi:D-alanyl-D-alanine carboxypeptidase